MDQIYTSIVDLNISSVANKVVLNINYLMMRALVGGRG
jgi:hypothetical protein